LGNDREEIENGMTFLGLMGLSDPPREESLASIQSCQRAGIVVHMLTGDHITTATAIAREVGIITESTDSVVMAQQLANMTESDFDSLAFLPLVVARCSPQTKVQMVNAIRRRGRLVAMIGDGVNDSLALQFADVGIAMGIAGSEVARQAAEIVLADDKFSTIVGAIKDGRRLFENQVKLILFLMSSNCAEVVVLVAGLAFLDRSGQPVYPLSPVQILWENLITSAFPAFA
jgi:P-type Na+/K+ transporter